MYRIISPAKKDVGRPARPHHPHYTVHFDIPAGTTRITEGSWAEWGVDTKELRIQLLALVLFQLLALVLFQLLALVRTEVPRALARSVGWHSG